MQSVLADGFGEDAERIIRLVDDLRLDDRRIDLVAEADDGVVGHVLLTSAWLDASPRLVDVLTLSPLAVASTHRRRGIGARLLEAGLAAADAAGAPAVFLEGDPAFYSTRGFEAAEPLGIARPSDRIPPAAFQVALLRAWEPWMASRFVYRDVFWRHDCVGLRG